MDQLRDCIDPNSTQMLMSTCLKATGTMRTIRYNMGKFKIRFKHTKNYRDHEKYEFADKEILGSGKYSEVYEGFLVDEPEKKCVIKIL
jgi:hypothetical protein